MPLESPPKDSPISFCWTVKTDIKLVDCLAAETSFSKSALKQYLSQGAVWIKPNPDSSSARVRRASKILSSGTEVRFHYHPTLLKEQCPHSRLVADLGYLSVWDKAAGVSCSGSKWCDHLTLTRWIETNQFQNRPSFLVHRLDKMTNGLIVVAHRKAIAQELSAQFAQRKVVKRYSALVGAQDYNKWINVSKRELPTSIMHDIDGKESISTILSATESLLGDLKVFQLEIEISSGRKHQIRSHLATEGMPIIGDRLFKSSYLSKDMQLTCTYLSFIDPKTAKKLTYKKQ